MKKKCVVAVYAEAVEALKRGDAFYARKKFKEAESLFTTKRMGCESKSYGWLCRLYKECFIQAVYF